MLPKGWGFPGLQRGITTIGAAQGDMIIQASQMLEHMLKGVGHSPFKGAVALALGIPKRRQQRAVLIGVA